MSFSKGEKETTIPTEPLAKRRGHERNGTRLCRGEFSSEEAVEKPKHGGEKLSAEKGPPGKK